MYASFAALYYDYKCQPQIRNQSILSIGAANIFLLFIYMSDLKPDVLLSQRAGRVIDDVAETLNYFRLAHLCAKI